MGDFWIVIVIILALLVGGLFVLPLHENKKLRKKAARQFGEVPQGRVGLHAAHTFWQHYAPTLPGAHLVDDTTWNDLEMDEVFARINSCQSAVGDAWLYAALRQPGTPPELLKQRLALRRAFDQNPKMRLETQVQLAKLGRGIETAGLEIPVFFPELLETPNPWKYYLLAAAPVLALLLTFLNTTIGVIACLVLLLGNYGVLIGFKGKNELGFLAVRRVAACMVAARHILPELKKDQPEFAKNLGDALRPFSVFSFGSSILAFNETMERLLLDPSAFFLLPLLSYLQLAGWLKKNSAAVLRLYSFLGEAELACCFASFDKTIAVSCQPQFCEESGVSFKNLCHPLLETPVPNSAAFGQNVLLTGSNASGKSTFIKAIAINLLLAQSAGLCLASSFRLKRGAVASSMAVRDNTAAGDSYFIAEIKSMRRLFLLAEQNDFCYFFIDEILKGTNTIERIAASASVLYTLNRAGVLCFTATHDIELTRILSGLYENFHFRETVDDTGVHFDYRLHQGPSTTRNAILLLQHMGFPPAVPQSAAQMAACFEQTGQWVNNLFSK